MQPEATHKPHPSNKNVVPETFELSIYFGLIYMF